MTTIRIDVRQGIEYAFVSTPAPTSPVIWYQADMYDYAGSPMGSRGGKGAVSNFAREVSLSPGEYVMLVRAAYEIRMFGDPHGGSPIIRLRVDMEVEEEEEEVEVGKVEEGGEGTRGQAVVINGAGVIPDVYDGWLMGEWISVPIRAQGNDVRVIKAVCRDVKVEMPGPVRIASGQIRPIGVRLDQNTPIDREVGQLSIRFEVEVGGSMRYVDWCIKLRQVDSSHSPVTFRMTFASPCVSLNQTPSLVSYATVIKPRPISDGQGKTRAPPVILALHGAGVDVDNPAWAEAIPAIPGTWAVLPQGKSEWGEDWHGGSMDEVWAARDALPRLLRRSDELISDETM